MPPVGPGSLPQLKNDTPKEFYQKTVARLERIQKHLDEKPRSGRVKDKVCIITGVGSLKGIGWVLLRLSSCGRRLTRYSRATSLLYAHEGARHLYLLDYAEENLPNLKETIEKKYPDVKVCGALYNL